MKPDEYWVPLIEKAYAKYLLIVLINVFFYIILAYIYKLYRFKGSYETIEGGSSLVSANFDLKISFICEFNFKLEINS